MRQGEYEEQRTPFAFAVVSKVDYEMVNEGEGDGSNNTYRSSRGRNESKRKGRVK